MSMKKKKAPGKKSERLQAVQFDNDDILIQDAPVLEGGDAQPLEFQQQPPPKARGLPQEIRLLSNVPPPPPPPSETSKFQLPPESEQLPPAKSEPQDLLSNIEAPRRRLLTLNKIGEKRKTLQQGPKSTHKLLMSDVRKDIESLNIDHLTITAADQLNVDNYGLSTYVMLTVTPANMTATVVDFSGYAQLTDLHLSMLGRIKDNRITSIICRGCINLTNWAAILVAIHSRDQREHGERSHGDSAGLVLGEGSLNRLKEIDFSSCKKMTEVAAVELLRLSVAKTINMSHTGLKMAVPGVVYIDCPIISDATETHKFPQNNVHRIVCINGPGVNQKFGQLLESGKLSDKNDHKEYLRYTSLKKDKLLFNIYECTAEMMDIFVHAEWDTHYVFAYNAWQDAEGPLLEAIRKFLTLLIRTGNVRHLPPLTLIGYTSKEHPVKVDANQIKASVQAKCGEWASHALYDLDAGTHLMTNLSYGQQLEVSVLEKAYYSIDGSLDINSFQSDKVDKELMACLSTRREESLIKCISPVLHKFVNSVSVSVSKVLSVATSGLMVNLEAVRHDDIFGTGENQEDRCTSPESAYIVLSLLGKVLFFPKCGTIVNFPQRIIKIINNVISWKCRTLGELSSNLVTDQKDWMPSQTTQLLEILDELNICFTTSPMDQTFGLLDKNSAIKDTLLLYHSNIWQKPKQWDHICPVKAGDDDTPEVLTMMCPQIRDFPDIFFTIARYLSKIHSIHTVWSGGIFLQMFMLDVGIYPVQDNSAIRIQCFKYSNMESAHVWNAMGRIVSVIRSVLADMQIYVYHKQPTADNEEVANMYKHVMAYKPVDVHKFNEDKLCRHCSETIEMASFIKKSHEHLNPKFYGFGGAKEFKNMELVKTTGNVALSGTYIQFTGKGHQSVSSIGLLTVGESFIVKCASSKLSKGLRCGIVSHNQSYMIYWDEKKEGFIVSEVEGTVSNEGITEFGVKWNCVTPHGVNWNSAKKDHDLNVLVYFENDEVKAGTIKVNFVFNYKYHLAFECKETRYRMLISNTLREPMDDEDYAILDIISTKTSSAEVEVGMRLEALDRKTPSLVCASTIIAIEEDGKRLLIHFDGWMATFDYWTESSSIDLHPIGWMAAVGHKNSKYNPIVQKPKGYDSKFYWKGYLQEINAKPVPYSWFSDAQTDGILDISEDMGAVGTSCKTISDRCEIWQTSLTKNYSSPHLPSGDNTQPDTVNILKIPYPKNMFSKHLKVVCLPQNLDIAIKYPSRSTVMDAPQTWYTTCQNELGVHLFNLQSVDMDCVWDLDSKEMLSESSAFRSFQAMVVRDLLDTNKDILPNKHDLILPVNESILELQSKLRVVMFMKYLEWNLHALEHVKVYSPDKIKIMEIDNERWVPSNIFGEQGHIPQNWMAFKEQFGENEVLQYASSTSLICAPHHMAKNIVQLSGDNETLPLHQFQGSENLIQSLLCNNPPTGGAVSVIPDDLGANLPQLVVLQLRKCNLETLPSSLGNLVALEKLDVGQNKLTELPTSLNKCVKMKCLDFSDNYIKKLPGEMFQLVELTEIIGCGNMLQYFIEPDLKSKVNASVFTELVSLNLGCNLLREVPYGLDKLHKLTRLNLTGVPWFDDLKPQDTMSKKMFLEIVDSVTTYKAIPMEEWEKMFHECDDNFLGYLDHLKVQKLNAMLFTKFPRFGHNGVWPFPASFERPDDAPPMYLYLSYHGFHKIPAEISKFKRLKNLTLSHNPILESISGDLVDTEIQVLNLKFCPALKTPPKEILSRGIEAITSYLKRIREGSKECKRTKLMMVGLGGAGKTSLTESLILSTENKQYMDYDSDEDDYPRLGHHRAQGTAAVTDGIDITDWVIDQHNEEGEPAEALTFSVWDFAGQTVYYNTHQFFLSNRAVYVLAWNIRLGYEHAGLDFWLNSIECHAPLAPCFIVGTHCDQVEKWNIPEETLRARYKQIVSFHYVSSFTLKGIGRLSKALVETALKQKYMGERIPEAWLSFETRVTSRREISALVDWDDVVDIAALSGIIDKVEVMQSIGFLHDLGTVQHFQNEFLKSKVVINPQWLVDVMACVVSVKTNAIKDGKLMHSDIGIIWEKYHSNLWPWLLRLTEEFDLTFPLNNEQANLVPCLLPETIPQVEWPEKKEGYKENKMQYKFEYLPAGLFNRLQVRLYQYCETTTIWKKGTQFYKNDNVVLVINDRVNHILVKVQGRHPENILFMIHEVIEGLIQESFHGVLYDYHIPCVDCMGDVDVGEPYMFANSKVRRATQHKAPFLQCDNFHTLSIPELHAVMPPDNEAEYDMHLERTMRDLNNLQIDLMNDVFLCYCFGDIPKPGQNKVHPEDIKKDLEKQGLSVWYSSELHNMKVDSLLLPLKQSKVLVICVSDNYISDKQCQDLFYFAYNSLIRNNKCKIQLVVLGNSLDWQKTEIGSRIISEVYIDMRKSDLYKSKMVDLTEAIKSKTDSGSKKSFPPCFISYCWSNSLDATKKGSRKVDSALGWGDPREIKEQLTARGVKCWIDVEQVGKNGLFEDITEGLLAAKVIVACISTEYANSVNCLREFRFALTTLKIPMFIAVVGSGNGWESTEIGMLSLGNPKVNFQKKNESACDDLAESVLAVLDQHKEEERMESERRVQREKEGDDQKQNAFKELLELAERKFLRQVTSYAESMNVAAIPRLVVIDLYTEEDLQLKKMQVNEESDASAFGKCNESAEVVSSAPDEDVIKNNDVTEDRDVPDAEAETEHPIAPDDLKHVKYCFRFLCEHEEEWHLSGSAVPYTENDEMKGSKFLEDIAPYMLRIMAILKHTSIDFKWLNSREGEQLISFLEEKCKPDHEFLNEYTQMCQKVIEHDKQKSNGDMARCHLPSGKTLWLCREHQKSTPRITILSEEAAKVSTASEDQDNILLKEIEKVAGPIKKEAPANKKNIRELRGKLLGAQVAAFAATDSFNKKLRKSRDGSKKSKACVLQ